MFKGENVDDDGKLKASLLRLNSVQTNETMTVHLL